jgi:2-dehydro-3-deoxygluconokinase
MDVTPNFNILKDDLSVYDGVEPAFVTFGETMIRDTPADMQRAERTRQIDISLSGSEHILCVGLSRLGIPCRYITRTPDNPYGWMLRNVSREQGIDTSYFVWAHKTELMGRYIYELGRTPRRSTAWYQRKYSAASQFGAGMVNWEAALKGARLFHASRDQLWAGNPQRVRAQFQPGGIRRSLGSHAKECRVGMDFNYRGTLWSIEQCKQVMTPIIPTMSIGSSLPSRIWLNCTG